MRRFALAIFQPHRFPLDWLRGKLKHISQIFRQGNSRRRLVSNLLHFFSPWSLLFGWVLVGFSSGGLFFFLFCIAPFDFSSLSAVSFPPRADIFFLARSSAQVHRRFAFLTSFQPVEGSFADPARVERAPLLLPAFSLFPTPPFQC